MDIGRTELDEVTEGLVIGSEDEANVDWSEELVTTTVEEISDGDTASAVAVEVESRLIVGRLLELLACVLEDVIFIVGKLSIVRLDSTEVVDSARVESGLIVERSLELLMATLLNVISFVRERPSVLLVIFEKDTVSATELELPTMELIELRLVDIELSITEVSPDKEDEFGVSEDELAAGDGVSMAAIEDELSVIKDVVLSVLEELPVVEIAGVSETEDDASVEEELESTKDSGTLVADVLVSVDLCEDDDVRLKLVVVVPELVLALSVIDAVTLVVLEAAISGSVIAEVALVLPIWEEEISLDSDVEDRAAVVAAALEVDRMLVKVSNSVEIEAEELTVRTKLESVATLMMVELSRPLLVLDSTDFELIIDTSIAVLLEAGEEIS